MDQDQLPSCISLLNVTRTSVALGSTSLAPASGTAIANLPRPSQTTTVTVGGATAASEFIGIPVGLVGVTQINFQVPSSIGIGTQPVVVTTGGVSSPAAQLSVTN